MSRVEKMGFTLVELMIVIAIIGIIAAIAIPNLMRSRTSANEAVAVSALKAYGTAQVTFHTGKFGVESANSMAGAKGYCDNYRNLYYGVHPNRPTDNLTLITQAFADAFGRAPGAGCASTNSSPIAAPGVPTAYQGYVFSEAKEMFDTDAAGNTRFATEFAMLGVPLLGGTTGENAYWIGLRGTVMMRGVPISVDYTLNIEVDTPSNPGLAAGIWITR